MHPTREDCLSILDEMGLCAEAYQRHYMVTVSQPGNVTKIPTMAYNARHAESIIRDMLIRSFQRRGMGYAQAMMFTESRFTLRARL